jgi:secreted protein with Ig-like and vWFA domain
MNLLQDLLGGGQKKEEYQDFVNRYQQGQPSEGYTGQEAAQRYQQVATQLPPAAYQQAAEQAFAQMSPEQRMQLAQMLQQQAMQQGSSSPPCRCRLNTIKTPASSPRR